jgi:hypothetical protein
MTGIILIAWALYLVWIAIADAPTRQAHLVVAWLVLLIGVMLELLL